MIQPLSYDHVHPKISSSRRLFVLWHFCRDLFIIYYCLFIVKSVHPWACSSFGFFIRTCLSYNIVWLFFPSLNFLPWYLDKCHNSAFNALISNEIEMYKQQCPGAFCDHFCLLFSLHFYYCNYLFFTERYVQAAGSTLRNPTTAQTRPTGGQETEPDTSDDVAEGSAGLDEE